MVYIDDERNTKNKTKKICRVPHIIFTDMLPVPPTYYVPGIVPRARAAAGKNIKNTVLVGLCSQGEFYHISNTSYGLSRASPPSITYFFSILSFIIYFNTWKEKSLPMTHLKSFFACSQPFNQCYKEHPHTCIFAHWRGYIFNNQGNILLGQRVGAFKTFMLFCHVSLQVDHYIYFLSIFIWILSSYYCLI